MENLRRADTACDMYLLNMGAGWIRYPPIAKESLKMDTLRNTMLYGKSKIPVLDKVIGQRLSISEKISFIEITLSF